MVMSSVKLGKFIFRRLHRLPNLRSHAGMSELIEAIYGFPLVLLIGFTALALGRGWYVRAAVEDAVAVGARWAATSLSGEQGCMQATMAMRTALSGFSLDVGAVQISVRPQARWGRGETAVVEVTYHLDQSGLPLVGAIGSHTIASRLTVPIDRNNNRYENGWRPCHS